MSKSLEVLESLQIGATHHGFRVERITPLPRMMMTAVELRHMKSGAKMLHLAADDAENLFSIAFRTPPPDDTGVPHILEHCVLCGSKRYPVKDPFVELLKTSLATFLNAATYPDRTLYPCASMNPKDFHNLMRVYCDAVFFPLLTEDHFRQEGHHFEITPEGKLTVKGVVYNEMRGVYSDPDGLLDRHVQQLLFESNAYGRDFGGDPKAIPSLTYQQYLQFHRDYYHPSNAWIFTYGNVELPVTLEVLDREYLSKFDARGFDTGIKPLALWDKPRQAAFTYPIDADDSMEGRTDIAVAFATNDKRDVMANLAMKVVNIYLLDNAASPLRKALIDSRLGQELGGSGHADYQRDTFFIVVLKGSEPDRAEAVEDLILKTVKAEVERGFDPGKVESALHRLELSSREIRPQYPLNLMDRVLGTWLYDSDPLGAVDISGHLDELRETLKRDKRLLERTAEQWLLDNTHRLRVTLSPDKEYVEKLDRETSAEMDRLLAGMSAGERREVAEVAARLEKMQSEGNTPEALATLPRLAKSDVSPEPLPLPYEVERAGAGDLLRVPMYAGGIGYLNLALQVSGLTEEELLLLPLLCEAMCKGGAGGMDYAAMAEREAASTGSLDFSAGMITHIDGPDKAVVRVAGWLKALDSEWPQAMSVFSDRLFRPDFTDKERLRDIVLQSRVGWRNQIVPSGNAYASLYAGRNLTPALGFAERLQGCTQARYIDRLASELDSILDSLPGRLDALHKKILAGATPIAAVLGADSTYAVVREWCAANADTFAGNGGRQQPFGPLGGSDRVGLAAPADIAYAACVMPGPSVADPMAPALVLLGTQLSFGYLWNEVRVKGGAYGVRASLDGGRGSFNFSSYRDPNIERTLGVYLKAQGFVDDEMDLSPQGVEQAVIGTFKQLDAPMRPSSAVLTALSRYASGETEAFRREFRSRLLGLAGEDIKKAADKVFSSMGGAPVCALSSREKLTEENAKMERPLDIEPLWEHA